MSVCVHVCVYVCINHKFVHMDNSSPVQARINKFGPEVQNTLRSILFWGLIDLNRQGQI